MQLSAQAVHWLRGKRFFFFLAGVSYGYEKMVGWFDTGNIGLIRLIAHGYLDVRDK